MAQMTPQPTPPSPSRNAAGALVFSAWILAVALITGAVGFLVFSLGLVSYAGPLVPIVAGGVAALSLPFWVRSLIKKRERWSLLAGWVFLSIAVLLGIVALNPVYGQVLIMVGLLQAAAPFAVMFFTDRARWWAAIPAYGLVAVSGLFALTIFSLSLEIIGAFALLAVALPLWLLYMLDRSNIWAIIPAGIISGIAIVLLLAFSLFQAAASTVYMIVNATLAVVTFALWLTVRRFDWALWLAVGFLAAAGISIVLPAGTWAMLALATGGYIIYRLVKINSANQQLPQPGAASSTPQVASPSNPPLPARAPSQPSKPANTASQPAAATGSPPPSQSGAAATNPHWRAIMADKAASEAAGSQPEEKKPVSGFRPLDPLADRKKDSGSEEPDS